MIVTEEERFMRFVSPEPNSGCWLWMGTGDANGYGMFRRTRSRAMSRAHRVAFELFIGPIPATLILDHKCRVRGCVNPDHLEPVTYKENAVRGDTGINSARKTHCPAGHEYNERNTYLDKSGRRHCRPCGYQSLKRRRLKKRAAA